MSLLVLQPYQQAVFAGVDRAAGPDRASMHVVRGHRGVCFMDHFDMSVDQLWELIRPEIDSTGFSAPTRHLGMREGEIGALKTGLRAASPIETEVCGG